MNRLRASLAFGAAATTLAIGFVSVRSGGGTSAEVPEGGSGLGATYASRSVGDLIVESTLIFRGQVMSIGKPVWNSPDGVDWTEDFEKDPGEYRVPPIPATPVVLAVEEVVSQQSVQTTNAAIPPLTLAERWR